MWFSAGLGTVLFMVGLRDLKDLFQPEWFYGNRLSQLPDTPFTLFFNELFHSSTPFWRGSFHWWGTPENNTAHYAIHRHGWHAMSGWFCSVKLNSSLLRPTGECFASGFGTVTALEARTQQQYRCHQRKQRALAQTQNHLHSAAIGMAWAWIWPGQLELCQIFSGHK